MTKNVKILITGDDAAPLNEIAMAMRAFFAARGWAFSVRVPALSQSPGLAQGYARIGKEDPEAAVRVDLDSLVVDPPLWKVVAAELVAPEEDSQAEFFMSDVAAREACNAYNAGQGTHNPEALQREPGTEWAVVRNA